MGLTKFISAYRIAHRLPGRIRIYIPVLEKLPEDWRKFLKPSTELIRMKRGIKSAEIQPISGSLLIGYDPEEMNEADILKWLETLVADFLKLETPSDRLDEANIGLRFALLRNRFSQKEAGPDLD
jgi:hypothetical protein